MYRAIASKMTMLGVDAGGGLHLFERHGALLFACFSVGVSRGGSVYMRAYPAPR